LIDRLSLATPRSAFGRLLREGQGGTDETGGDQPADAGGAAPAAHAVTADGRV